MNIATNPIVRRRVRKPVPLRQAAEGAGLIFIWLPGIREIGLELGAAPPLSTQHVVSLFVLGMVLRELFLGPISGAIGASGRWCRALRLRSRHAGGAVNAIAQMVDPWTRPPGHRRGGTQDRDPRHDLRPVRGKGHGSRHVLSVLAHPRSHECIGAGRIVLETVAGLNLPKAPTPRR